MSPHRAVQRFLISRNTVASAFTFFCAVCAVAACLLLPSATADEHSTNPLVLRLSLNREVEPVLATYIDEGLADAATRHAALV